ncbi:MAG TPA: hypothetical protein VGB24_22530 [Longimicrobium sp.]|jgi:hypothetical protein|uniref:hypothetical protein n=1 Tax=Longimicrobium sp. TaxID=2029185 RepID=UPI002EDAC308
MRDDVSRDPALAAALHDAAGAPAPKVDWEALRARISAEARVPLARRRQSRRTSVRLRALLPLAAAAGIAGLALATVPERRPAAVTPQERSEIQAALRESLPDQVALLISGEAAEAALLESAEENAAEN